MKCAIMQPYFFPYIGYIQLLANVDKWVFFDNIQFIDKGWINRNRILHPEEKKEWQFLTIPLDNKGQFTKIKDLHIKNHNDWRKEIIGKLSFYKRIAPNFKFTMNFVEECLSINEQYLSTFLYKNLIKMCEILEIKTEIILQSSLNLDVKKVSHPGQWALNISKTIGADSYINPITGAHLFVEKEFSDLNIKLNFIRPRIREYNQKRVNFVPLLSILDVMMFNDICEIKKMLQEDFEIISPSEL